MRTAGMKARLPSQRASTAMARLGSKVEAEELGDGAQVGCRGVERLQVEVDEVRASAFPDRPALDSSVDRAEEAQAGDVVVDLVVELAGDTAGEGAVVGVKGAAVNPVDAEHVEQRGATELLQQSVVLGVLDVDEASVGLDGGGAEHLGVADVGREPGTGGRSVVLGVGVERAVVLGGELGDGAQRAELLQQRAVGGGGAVERGVLAVGISKRPPAGCSRSSLGGVYQ
jgi:hypothetical protein